MESMSFVLLTSMFDLGVILGASHSLGLESETFCLNSSMPACDRHESVQE